MVNFDQIPFVQAKWYTPAERRRVRLIVLHTMEAPDKPDTAEAVARYFTQLPPTRKASAHYCVDANSIVQCVQTKDVAYGAPSANRDGIHIEMAGYARQRAADWASEYNQQMLDLVAQLCARVLLPKYKIPTVYLAAPMLKAPGGHSGFTTHVEVSKAFGGTHWDPGPDFPMLEFMRRVRAAVLGGTK